jgi:hypothetical protein
MSRLTGEALEGAYEEKYALNEKEYWVPFNGEKYFLCWHAFQKDTIFLEFLRKGESLENYTKMITIVRCSPDVIFEKYIKSYIEFTKKFRMGDARVLIKGNSIHKKEWLVDVMLKDEKSNRVEHVLHRVILGNNDIVTTITLSSVFKLDEYLSNKSISAEIKREINTWIEGLSEIEFEVL